MKKNQGENLTAVEEMAVLKKKQEEYGDMISGLFNKNKLNVSSGWIERSLDCGSIVLFKSTKDFEKTKVHRANFCGKRLCPLCQKRKSLKDTIGLNVITKYISEEKKRRFIFLTLTVPNVGGDALDDKIREMNTAFSNLTKRKKFKNCVKGCVKKLEVTFKQKNDTYHPHFHVLIAVEPSYFNNKNKYLTQSDWLEEWRTVMDDTSITQVDVRAFRGKAEKPGSGIKEIAKYVAKDSNFLLNEEVFLTFFKSLKKKNIFSFSGDFREAKRKYIKGELDHLLEKEEIEWYWLLCMRYEHGSYSEFQREKFTDYMVKKEEKELKEDIF